jgi:hypothetical protein
MKALEDIPVSRPPAGAVLSLSVLLLAGATAWILVQSPSMLAEQEQQDAAAMAAESHGLCERLGIVRDSAAFAACISEVSQAIQRHDEQRQDRAASLL